MIETLRRQRLFGVFQPGTTPLPPPPPQGAQTLDGLRRSRLLGIWQPRGSAPPPPPLMPCGLSHRTEWGGLAVNAARIALSWGELSPSTGRLSAPWGETLPTRRRHAAGWGDVARAKSRVVTPWHDAGRVSSRLVAAHSELAVARRSHRAGYGLMASCQARHACAWAISDRDFAAARCAASWSLLANPGLQPVANTPELFWHGRKLSLLSASISCDEDSPAWLARMALSSLADFSVIGIGDALTLALSDETFRFAVDGKSLSREGPGEMRLEITALSPIALLDAPFAASMTWFRAAATPARTAVELLLGQAVDWRLPDWIVPANRLLFENTTPLAAARAIVAAIGGLLESAPDGTAICRRRHPVPVPDYGTATVAHGLFDADVISATARIAPLRGFNRVTIANDDGQAAQSGDVVEFVRDEGDDNRGTVRAYLSTSRPVRLTHTGNPATVIAALGEVTRTETETIEIVEGAGRLRYAAKSLQSQSWRHADLGRVTLYGQEARAEIPGYSLLRLDYTVTSLDWRVALASDEEVQFVLMDV